jgi:hypothetical protein
MTTFSERRLRDVDFMPRSKGRCPKTIQVLHLLPLPAKSRRYLGKIAAVSCRLWQSIVGASVLVTLAAGALFFLPRVTVEASGPFDASPEPAITFTVTNAGVFPLADVKPYLGLCAVSLNFGIADDNPKPPFNKCNEKSTGFLSPTNWRHSWMRVDEKESVIWSDAFRNQTPGILDYADIIITIAYSPWVFPFHRQKTFRFVTRKLGDGKVYWLPRPMAN